MALIEDYERTGRWLFSWRSYLPLLMTLLVVAALITPGSDMVGQQYRTLWSIVCACVAFFGSIIRLTAVGYVPEGTSERTTGEPRASSLNTSGIYSAVRHPLYLGNFFNWLGVSMLAGSWWLSLLFALLYWVYYERIMFAEEGFLRQKFGNAFEEWAARTPAFVPSFKNWQPTDARFSLKKVLRSEYSGWFAVVGILTVLETVRLFITHRKLSIELGWLAFFLIGLTLYVTVLVIKKTTHLLR